MNTLLKQKRRSSSTKPTISDLAEKLSLSKGSVSRILNDKGAAFSEETRSRVFAVAQEIGYAPNALARALATGRSGFVAVWMQTLVTSYHAQVAHTMEKALERSGYQIAVTPFGRLDRSREEYTGIPAGVDGMIAHEIYSDIWPLLFQDAGRKTPVVTTGIFAPEGSRDHVQVDLAGAAEEAVRHLVASGRKRIAYASDDMDTRTEDKRYQAYQKVIAEAGLAWERIGLPSQNRDAIRRSLRDYVLENGCPGAIFCHNDDTAIAAYRALLDLELRVPNDCALVGCDGIPDTEYLPVPISTIVQPYEAVCETACQFLKRRIAEPDCPPQRAIYPAVLEIRQSSLV